MDKQYIEEHMHQPIIKETCLAILGNFFADETLKNKAVAYLNTYETNSDEAFEATRRLLSAAVKYRMTNKQVADVLTIQAKLDNVDAKQASIYATRARKLDAQGIVYCDCPACTACTRILELK